MSNVMRNMTGLVLLLCTLVSGFGFAHAGVSPEGAVRASSGGHSYLQTAQLAQERRQVQFGAGQEEQEYAPSEGSGGGILAGMLAFLLGGLLVWLAALVHVVKSDRSRGGAKLGWFLLVFFTHLVGYAVFLIVTAGKKPGQ